MRSGRSWNISSQIGVNLSYDNEMVLFGNFGRSGSANAAPKKINTFPPKIERVSVISRRPQQEKSLRRSPRKFSWSLAHGSLLYISSIFSSFTFGCAVHTTFEQPQSGPHATFRDEWSFVQTRQHPFHARKGYPNPSQLAAESLL